MTAEQANPTEDNENISITWARLFVDELARAGLGAVCIAPGSRSTPLALAFHANKQIEIFRHLDERSAGFFALGMALASQKPVALLCTSGTAAANFLPAIIEAKMSQVPLLVLTADRPPELRHSGANQTIDQVKMYGDFVLSSVDFALPQPDAPPVALRNARSLAARALAVSDGVVKGPVHINFPFRKPLEPLDPERWSRPNDAGPNAFPHVKIEHGRIEPTAAQVDFLGRLMIDCPRGLIVCGPRCPSGDFPAAVTRLASCAGYPLLADPLSGLRFTDNENNAAIIGGYETFLQNDRFDTLRPDIILRFGAVPTSKWLNRFLESCQQSSHVHVRESGQWADENHTTGHFYQVNPAQLCRGVSAVLTCEPDGSWRRDWERLEKGCWDIMSGQLQQMTFDGAVAAAVLDQLPANASLFLGNSLPIRHVDQFGKPQKKRIHLYGNRGASGIDGNISSGLGMAAASAGPSALLVGDITFYHDSNGLLAIRNLGLSNLTIVLLNNNGGGIFRRLPVAAFDPPFEELFITPHNLDFAPFAGIYGLNYARVSDLSSFTAVFAAALASETATIVEVLTDGTQDDLARRRIAADVQANFAPWKTG